MSNDDNQRGAQDSEEGGGSSDDGGVLPKLNYSFMCKDPVDVDFRVRRAHLVENLNRPYELNLEIVTREREFQIEDLLGVACELKMERDLLVRSVYGVIHRFDFLGISANDLVIRVYVAPALALMSQRVNCRLWQEKSAKDIIEEILGEGLADYQRKHEWDLGREPEPRDYCVQYNESDLDFVHRLLEEEGIAYHFLQPDDEGAEILRFVDRNESFPPVETLDQAAEIPIIETHQGNAEMESIQFFDLCRSLHSTSVVRRDFDFERPTNALHHENRSTDLRGLDREFFEYAPRRFVGDIGESQVLIRAQELAVGGNVGRGHSNVTDFAPGVCFEITMYEKTTKYLITRVVHRADCPEELVMDGADGAGAEERYENSFECIPFDVPYRPPALALKPKILGPQTATVVGPHGDGSDGGKEDDIHTDSHGRVRVKFHWDRSEGTGDDASCWVRVRQSWAGGGWGTLFVPRVGMEAVVEFSDGDPDRPLVTGCVYNGRNETPYPLPDEKTKSTAKSNSSPPTAEGFNEICFEDHVDNEVLSLHAQKDLTETVLNNHTTRVHGNNSNTVSGSQSITTGPRTIKVDEKEEKTIEGTRKIEVTGEDNEIFGDYRNTHVTGIDNTEVTEKSQLIAPDVQVTGEDKVLIQTDGSHTINMTTGDVTTAGKEIHCNSESVVRIQCGGSNFVEVTQSGVQIDGSTGVEIYGGGGTISVGIMDIEIKAGGGTIKLDAAGVTVSGAPMIKLN